MVKEVTLFLLGMAALSFGLLAVFMIPAVAISKFDCSQLEANTGLETEYHILGGGCLVNVDGQLIPRENWRVTPEGN